jgi:uncharacterized membrane protein
MLYIGIAHLSFRRIEFQAQVPVWLTKDEFWIDFIVVISGYIEIIFGIMMIIGVTNFQDINQVKVFDSNNAEVASYEVGLIPGDFAFWKSN